MTVSTVLVSICLIMISLWYKDLLITALLAVIPILSSIYTIAQYNYEKNLSSTKTVVVVDTSGNRAVVTCTLKSFHPKRIFIDKAYLFVDSGKEQNGIYEFKHVLRHEYGDESCLVEKKMTSGGITCYNDINTEGKGLFCELPHLSSSTILYVDPNEEFSDDCVVQLEDGVYRAMFVVTFKNADCNCAMKHFIIDSNTGKTIEPASDTHLSQENKID